MRRGRKSEIKLGDANAYIFTELYWVALLVGHLPCACVSTSQRFEVHLFAHLQFHIAVTFQPLMRSWQRFEPINWRYSKVGEFRTIKANTESSTQLFGTVTTPVHNSLMTYIIISLYLYRTLSIIPWRFCYQRSSPV